MEVKLESQRNARGGGRGEEEKEKKLDEAKALIYQSNSLSSREEECEIE